MTDKDKTKTNPASAETPAAARQQAETPPDTETQAKPVAGKIEGPALKAKDEAKPVEAKPAKTQAKSEADCVAQPLAPRPALPHRTGLFGKGKSGSGESKADLFSLADATGTNSIILAALKAAYGWTERTRLTRAEFRKKREAWLTRPAKEG